MSAKILVVDDEFDLQELVKRKFRREIRRGEFEFVFADDGVAALEALNGNPDVELVISDINMPRMDGLTLLDHLSDFEEQLKTIIISAYGDMDNIRTAMNRGASDFVTKPIDFQDLLITMKKSLDQLDLLKEAVEHRFAAERAKGNLSRYFSPKMVDLLANQDTPLGEPREQEIAVLFADIRGFTSLSETMAPAEVMTILREFHAFMESIIFKHDGALDQVIGDALLATFGTPQPGPHDASNALKCADEMLHGLAAWNEQREAAGKPAVRIGIGIHHGTAVMGDIGSERSMTFTVIGDTVNAASRLESLTRQLDTDLIISRALADRVLAEHQDGTKSILDKLKPAGEHDIRGRNGKIELLAR